VIDDLGGLPRLLMSIPGISSDKRLAAELRGLSFDLDRPAADVARQLAGIVLDAVKASTEPVAVAGIEREFTRHPAAMTTLTYVVLSGLRVKMNTVIARHSGDAAPTNDLGGASADVWMVEDFDQGGVFSIVPLEDREVRLHIPQIRLHLLRARIAEWIGRAHDYASLFPFPSFDMNPNLFEAAVAAVLTARLNALRSTRGERIRFTDIFPGCSMTKRVSYMEVDALPMRFDLQQEIWPGDVRAAAGSTGARVLGEHVHIAQGVTRRLEETIGSVLRGEGTTKCIDVHFVLPQPNTDRLAHFGIQCKSGASKRFDALKMYEEAMAYMAPVAGMDHYFVLAALHPERARRPPKGAWPDGLILMDTLADFAPLMRTLPSTRPGRGRRGGSGLVKARDSGVGEWGPREDTHCGLPARAPRRAHWALSSHQVAIG
ncbi:MAG: hypothetical protein KIT86_24930, partial [Hydrogenophaga sp.]|uniref:hypothetical protein n=1 Tax=Hydrogenophaga sp. TaxID=1904254 RepID=UPI002629FDC4